ncbi:MAG: SIS domain-containing protein [Candidatus Hodarchaeales archaeon]|jgi:D-arabinose 5-phosphate isomerase GutQ
MNSSSEMEIAAFKSAFQFFIRTAQGTVNKINTNPRNLADFCQILSNAQEKNTKIHIIGSGRSGHIGKILGECLKDIGCDVSFFGDSLTSSVATEDVALVITGSGWTNYTTSAIEICIRNNAKILTFTGSMSSKAARLSDAVIQIPLGYLSQDYNLFHSEEVVPVSPLGTIFELTTLVIGVGVINGIFSGSCTNGFNSGTSAILTSAEQTFENLIYDRNLSLPKV